VGAAKIAEGEFAIVKGWIREVAGAVDNKTCIEKLVGMYLSTPCSLYEILATF
jgi:hypothetical protein